MRLQILERDGWRCTLCGDKETTLHVHHEEYNGEPWQADPAKLKTLCKDCHELISVIIQHYTLTKVRKEIGGFLCCDNDGNMIFVHPLIDGGWHHVLVPIVLITEFLKGVNSGK